MTAASGRSSARVVATALVGTLVVSAGLGLSSAACAGGDEGDEDGRLVVLAAASLTDAFAILAGRFEADHPGVDVQVSIAGSSALVTAITEGAPADVFAAADRRTMQQVVEAGEAAGDPEVFVRNRLVLGVPAGNPASVDELADLSRSELAVGLCAEVVPCGALSAQLLAEAGVDPAPDTEEPDVRALLRKLAAGELDAGLVYETDAAAETGVRAAATFPDGPATSYSVVSLRAAGDPELAERFVDFVASDVARTILADQGFVVD